MQQPDVEYEPVYDWQVVFKQTGEVFRERGYRRDEIEKKFSVLAWDFMPIPGSLMYRKVSK